MTQNISQRFRVDSVCQRMRCEGVPQVMEPYVRQSRFLQNSFHGEVGTVRRDRLFRSDGIPENPLTVRLLAPLPQELSGTSGEQYLSLACTCLGFASAQLSVFVSMERSPHMECAGLDIEV